MTLATGGLKPSPLPPTAVAPHEPGNPKLWHHTDLVRFNYDITKPATTAGKPAEVTTKSYVFDGSPAVHNNKPFQPGTLKELGVRGPSGHVSSFGPAAAYGPVGTSFAEAIAAANKTAKFTTGPTGRALDAAHAVLQAGDGQYYVTMLRSLDSAASLNAQARKGSQSTVALSGVEPLHPDVKAVVDRDEWINFSGQPVEVELAN